MIIRLNNRPLFEGDELLDNSDEEVYILDSNCQRSHKKRTQAYTIADFP